MDIVRINLVGCGPWMSLTRFSRLLVRHPKALARLRREIVSVLGDEEYPTRDQIRKMPYLTFVVKESKCDQLLLPNSQPTDKQS